MTKLPKPSSPNLDRLFGSITNDPEARSKDDADICPFALNIISWLLLFIWSSWISNPPIVPPSASISPIIFTSPLVDKWNLLELISIIPPEALINCVFSEPTKNDWARISNIDGSDLNLKKLSLSPTNSNPTPS